MFQDHISSLFLVVLLWRMSVVSSSPVVQQGSLQLEWESWKSTHGKRYSHDREDRERSAVWLSNRELVESHNALGGGSSYSLAMNQFGDMTDREFSDQYLGSSPTLNNATFKGAVFQSGSEDLPNDMDWRTKNAVAPVKNQGQCNSSYAFSAIAALEGASALVNGGKPIPFSEQNILDCTVPYGNHGCTGGSVYNTYQYVLSEGGIDRAIDYPYKGKQGQCFFDDRTSAAEISGMVRIESGSESSLLAAVATVGPIAVTVDASSSSFRFYSGGVLDTVHCSSTTLNHAMAIIGYGSSKGRKYWLVKNSWGKSWGEGGYIKMVRDSYNQCGIASDAIYPTL